MRAVLSVAIALLVAGCAEATGPAADIRVETSRSVYPLPGTPSVPVQYWVRNTGSTTVALANCGAGVAAEVQRRSGNTWETAVLMQCPAIYAPIILAPGEAVGGQAALAEAGEYRIRVGVADEEGAQFSSYAVSSSFAVRWLED